MSSPARGAAKQLFRKRRCGGKSRIRAATRYGRRIGRPFLRPCGCYPAGERDGRRYDDVSMNDQLASQRHQPRRRLSARLDPVRTDLRLARRRGRCAQDRLRQYRRDQCAAHRQIWAAALTLLFDAREGRGGCADRAAFLGRGCGAVRGAGRVSRPSLSGLARLQGRQRHRGVARHSAGARIGRSALLALRDLGRGAGGVPHLVAVRAGRGRCGAGLYVLSDRPHEALLAVVLAVLVFIVHRENIRRLLRGEEPRIGAEKRRVMTRDLSEAERRAWLRLARTQNVGPVTFAQLIARSARRPRARGTAAPQQPRRRRTRCAAVRCRRAATKSTGSQASADA